MSFLEINSAILAASDRLFPLEARSVGWPAGHHLGSERLREAVGRNTEVALEVLHHGPGEGKRVPPLDHLLFRQVVLDHELGQVADDLGGRGHLRNSRAREEKKTHRNKIKEKCDFVIHPFGKIILQKRALGRGVLTRT